MKLLLLLTLLLPSCALLPTGTYIGYTGQGVEVTGMTGELSGAGYNLLTRRAYLVYADGTQRTLRITGTGVGAGKISLYLEGGAKITVDTRTGTITTGAALVPQK